MRKFIRYKRVNEILRRLKIKVISSEAIANIQIKSGFINYLQVIERCATQQFYN